MNIKKTIILITVLIVSLVLYLWVDNQFGTHSSGPKKVILRKQTCDFCRMHIDDIRFTAQIQLKSGKTYFFDDPGELMILKNKINEEVLNIYYHHYFEDRWILEKDVAFIEVGESPMGFNIAAVTKDFQLNENEISNGKKIFNKAEALFHVNLTYQKNKDKHKDKHKSH